MCKSIGRGLYGGRKCGYLWSICTGWLVHLHRISGAFVPYDWSICSTVGFMYHRNEGLKVGHCSAAYELSQPIKQTYECSCTTFPSSAVHLTSSGFKRPVHFSQCLRCACINNIFSYLGVSPAEKSEISVSCASKGR